MDSIVLFLKEDILPRISQKLIRCVKRLLNFGCPKTKNCTNALSLGHTCYAYTLRHRS